MQGADGIEISTDPARLDVARVHRWLSTDAYWALGRSLETVERAIAGSLSFGAYDADGSQVGYARVVTDHATFGWLCDVYVAPSHRGRGIGTLLATSVRDELAPDRLRHLLLFTADAHAVYASVGFTPLADPARVMVLSTDAVPPPGP